MRALFLRRNNQALWQWGLGLLFGVLFATVWQIAGYMEGGLLMATFTGSVGSFIKFIGSPKFWQALFLSNQAMVFGFALALLVGIPLGLLIGRVRGIERFVDWYLNGMMVTPMAAILPLVMISIGIGLTSRVLVVFLFTFVVVTVNTRAGLRSISPSLIEMACSYGANERQLWQKVLLPGAMPGIMAGIRLGLGRSITAMVTVELLLVAVGIGAMMLDAQMMYRSADLYAVIMAIIVESVLLMGLARIIEARLLPWRHVVEME